MWLAYALGSAVFSGMTSVLAKYGIRKVDSTLTVALRSVVILAFAWTTTLITGGYADIGRIGARELVFPLLSGVTNALSWVCYFKALKTGSINQVAAVDKAGITLTMIGGWLILGEPMTAAKLTSIALILTGALLMIEREGETAHKDKSPLFWAVLSALFTAATTILSKISVEKIDSDLGFAIRTGVIFVMTWASVCFRGKHREIAEISRKSMIFIGLSGLSTALAWLCYFRALGSPDAQAGIVQPIDKLSILVSVAFAAILFKEKLSRRSIAGLSILTAGILILLL